MTQLPLLADQPSDLAAFFSRIHTATDKNPLTHGIHPYPAKFIPHIPRALIAAFSTKGDLVCDPMCGSGTTLVEAAVAGRRSVGSDINPVGVLVAKAKLVVLDDQDRAAMNELMARLGETEAKLRSGVTTPRDLDQAEDLPRFHNRDKWFSLDVVHELMHLRSSVRDLPSEPARHIALATFSSIIVAVSNQESETRWCAKPRQVHPGEATRRFLNRVLEATRRSAAFASKDPAQAAVVRADARRLPVRDGAAKLVVTSPPYANSHDYYLYNKLRLFWLGEDVAPVQSAEIGSRHRHSDLREDIEVYLREMAQVFSEVHRVLDRQGKAAVVVADAVIRKRLYAMDDLLSREADEVGMRLSEKHAFSHVPLNSTFQRGFGTKSPKQTHVLIFEKT